MNEKILNSNQTLFQSTVGEVVNEWLTDVDRDLFTTKEPVVSVSNHYAISYDKDYSGELRVHRIEDEFGTVLWENWNATCWTEAEDKLISEIIMWGELA
tara:strand:- start:70 stop:366 length:297 start_codon:yes stop_codon:yes gene_type:complete